MDEPYYKEAAAQSREQLEEYVGTEITRLADADQLECLSILSKAVDARHLIAKAKCTLVLFSNIPDRTMCDLYVHIAKCKHNNSEKMKTITEMTPAEKNTA